MIKRKVHILGLITARGGSKGIPRKNIIPLAGKPLLAYTCEAALESKCLTRIVLSTDDKEIAGLGRKYKIEVPFLRPARLARNNTPSLDVAMHAVKWLGKNEKWIPDVLVLLQPTSPLRRGRHIDQAMKIFKDTAADAVVSVVGVPHRFSPYNLMALKNNWLQDFWKGKVKFDRFQRQEMPKLYSRNGPAILIVKTSALFKYNSFYGGKVAAYKMKEEDSIDIDTIFDLKLAELLLRIK